MSKYVNINGRVEKVEVGESTYERYLSKGFEFYSTYEGALMGGRFSTKIERSSNITNFGFNTNLPNSNRGKFN